MPKKKKFEDLVSQGRNLLDEHEPVRAHSHFQYWVNAVSAWLDNNLPNTGLSAEWCSLRGSLMVTGGGYHNDDQAWSFFRVAIRERMSWLSRIPSLIVEESDDKEQIDSKRSGDLNSVFVVHGRDEATRETAARLIETLKLKPVILHEQPNKGRTIIEKFDHHSAVSFAVVLLTGDDLGGLNNTGAPKLFPRARQNVILELGYFLGKLGRDKVCAIYQEGVEIPSDYDGVLFIPLDAGGAWKYRLAKELKEAGLPVDMNVVT